jgi:hypothetical protein
LQEAEEAGGEAKEEEAVAAVWGVALLELPLPPAALSLPPLPASPSSCSAILSPPRPPSSPVTFAPPATLSNDRCRLAEGAPAATAASFLLPLSAVLSFWSFWHGSHFIWYPRPASELKTLPQWWHESVDPAPPAPPAPPVFRAAAAPSAMSLWSMLISLVADVDTGITHRRTASKPLAQYRSQSMGGREGGRGDA